jgi:hypothetical protein
MCTTRAIANVRMLESSHAFLDTHALQMVVQAMRCAQSVASLQFHRSPLDLAFAAGNQTLYSILATVPRKTPVPAASPDLPQAPPPDDFWSFLQQARPAPAAPPAAAHASAAPQAVAPQQPAATPPGAVTADAHPRKQFEAWLGSMLFPQRVQGQPSNAPEERPYTSVHKTGAVGGSVFKQRHAEKARAEAEAAQVAQAAQARAKSAADCNVQLSLDPYEDTKVAYPGGVPQPAMVGSGTAARPPQAPVASQHGPANPFGGLMKAVGDKAQKDIGTVMSALQGKPQPPRAAGQSGGTLPVARFWCAHNHAV